MSPPAPAPARLPALLALALLLAFLAGNAAWLAQDRLVRDGDEEGHVGAAELFVHDLRSADWGMAASRALWQDMGDYPALYPAVVGVWWWATGEGQPERPAVRAVNLGFLLLAALGVAGAGRRLGLERGAAALGGAAVLALPLNVGLARHFMPEGAVVAMAALTVWAAAAQDPRRSLGPGLALGLCLGLGLLSKQTFPLAVLVPLLVLVRPGPALIWVGLGAGVALPWVVNNWQEQRAYGAASAAYASDASTLDHLVYYPVELGSSALGPVWALLLVGLLPVALRGPGARAGRLGLAWLVGGLLVLTAIPKKYDRLAAPLLPAAGLIVGAAVAARPRLGWGLLLPAAWTGWVSVADTRWSRPSAFVEDFHPGCAQRWVRPPDPRGLGFEALAARLEPLPPGPVAVLAGPEIPCEVQTTFGWTAHLEPWLRRAGQERAVVEDPAGAVLVVDFGPDPRGEERLQVPVLGVEARLWQPGRR